MPGLIIRPMTREDVPAVSAVDRLCFTLHWSENSFAAETTNTVGRYLVAELDGRIVGYIGAHVIMDEAHVTTFGVHPDCRRRGIGERLLVEMLRRAMDAGCRRVTLEVRESNLGAQALYRRYGFAPISRRRAYYSDDQEDAVVMWIDDMSRAGFRMLFAERLAGLDAAEEVGG